MSTPTMSVSNPAIIEAFLDHLVAEGHSSFNVPAAVAWIGANYVRSDGQDWTNGMISRMIQHYVHCNTRVGVSGVRSDAFIPSHVIDCDMRGGPNAAWTITETDHDLGNSMRRTARDIADTLTNRAKQRINPAVLAHPVVEQSLKAMHVSAEANALMLLTVANSLP